ncbi:MAG: protein kinase [Caldilineales bacterium]|nr:protein kinase [Caldilineales bacterium]
MARLLDVLSPTAEETRRRPQEVQGLVQRGVARFRQLAQREGSDSLASPWILSSDQQMAVRVLRRVSDLTKQRSLADLGRQIQMLTLNHPGLAPLVEMAIYESYPYVVARLRAGVHPLSAEVRGPMERRRALRLIYQVVEALQYLHHHGYFHGNLSPDDIFVDESGLPLITGVGLEQVRRLLNIQAHPQPTALTPPEVAQGASPDARSDVYAVAALAYLLLTGKPPVPGRPTHLARDVAGLPPSLDAVLTKALAASPDERYANLVEMARALRPALHEARLGSRRPSQPEQPSGAAPAASQRARPPSRPPAVSAGFPDPLPMPEIDLSELSRPLQMPEVPTLETVEIPTVDWAALLKPLNLAETLPSAPEAEAPSSPDAKMATPSPEPAAAPAPPRARRTRAQPPPRQPAPPRQPLQP